MTRRLPRVIATAWVSTTLLAVGAAAQATGLPAFHAPTRAFGDSETGFAVSRPGGGVTGLELRLGFALDEADLALRGGYVDRGGNADGDWVAGLEGRIPVLGASSGFPLDGALILGVGRRFADGGGQTIVPVGLSLGRRLVLGGNALVITPYAQPTVIFEGDELKTLGLGIDLRIRDLPEIRMSWAVGDLEGVAVSLFWSR